MGGGQSSGHRPHRQGKRRTGLPCKEGRSCLGTSATWTNWLPTEKWVQEPGRNCNGLQTFFQQTVSTLITILQNYIGSWIPSPIGADLGTMRDIACACSVESDYPPSRSSLQSTCWAFMDLQKMKPNSISSALFAGSQRLSVKLRNSRSSPCNRQ